MPGVVLQGKLDLATKRPSGLGSNGSYHTGRRTPQGFPSLTGKHGLVRLGSGTTPIRVLVSFCLGTTSSFIANPQRDELGFFQWLDGEIVDAGFLMQTDRDSACKSTLP